MSKYIQLTYRAASKIANEEGHFEGVDEKFDAVVGWHIGQSRELVDDDFDESTLSSEYEIYID